MTERFTIQHILQQHATGQTARALDSRSGLPVVIRVFRCASEDERNSLEALMSTLADLRHPNIEPVHEVIRAGQDLIITTEEPQGETIDEVLANGPLSVDEFRPMATQLLGALSAAHQRGAVHGSIHAGRIRIDRNAGPQWKTMITGYGLGFGDAKPDESACFLCVPPEQWEQQPARRRSDVYSLGCIFYQALSGRSPFDGKSLKEIRHKHVKHDLRPIEQVAPQAPAWLCKWVMTLLEPDPERRPESATAALDRYRTAEVSRNTVSIPLSAASPAAAQIPATTGFVQVAGAAFFRVPNVMTQTVSVKPIDPMIHTARQTARQNPRSPAATAAQRPGQPGARRTPSQRASVKTSPTGRTSASQPVKDKKWLIIGGVTALVVIGVGAALLRGGKKEPVKVASNPVIPTTPVKVSANPNPPSNELPPVTAGYPTGRQKPVNYPKLVFHAMCDGGVQSTRTDASKKHQPANVNDDVFAWRDFAERGRDSGLSFPSGQGDTYPKFVSLKPDATFPLARERRFIRFSGEGSPAAVLTSSAKNQAKEFPFGPTSPSSARGLTFAIVFFQEVKGRVQTLFHLSGPQGSAVLRLSEKGDLRFNGRKNGIPDNQQHPTITINADKFNPVEPLLVIGSWNAEPGEAFLKVRSASGYAFQTTPVKAPVPGDSLGNLMIGREGLPGANSANKSTDPVALRAFSGGVAEILIYSAALNEGEMKSLEAQLADVYFPRPKP